VLAALLQLIAVRGATRPADPGLIPWRCPSKSHDREHLGLRGRRVLVSREWSGKTLAEHKANRGAVVREALLSAGMVAPEIEGLAASVRAPDGLSRHVWTHGRSPTLPATCGRSWRRSPSGNGGEPNTKQLWILFQQLARRMKEVSCSAEGC
jgi:hypothetical protein